MAKRLLGQSAILSFILVVLSTLALAQEQIATPNAASPVSSSPSAMARLATLPEADTLIYINTSRLLNEAAPKLLPEAELAKMRQQFTELRGFVGVDPSRVDFVVIGMRFRRPTADLHFVAPEFLVVSTGDFSAESLLTVARLALQEKLTDERYGTRNMSLVTIDEIARQSEKNPILRSFSQLGLAALSTNMLAAGNVDYLKAALDAADGRDRIKPETLNSLLRDVNALVSFAGSPWNSFAKSFGLRGTSDSPREAGCDSKLGDFYAAITMEETTFKLRGAMNADNPDTAKIINNLFSGMLRSMASGAGNNKSVAALKMLSFSPHDSEVRLEADIPQQIVADFIREQMKPKPAEPAKKPAATRPVRKRRPNR